MISRHLDASNPHVISGNLRALTPEEIAETPESSREIIDLGYTVIRKALSDEEVMRLRDDIDLVFEAVPRDSSIREGKEFRHRVLNHSALCQETVSHPSIRRTLNPVLGENFHVIANTAWRQDAIEQDSNAWHVDAGPHIPLPDGVEWPENIPHPIFAVGVHILLEDCPIEAGPTGVIPKSHLSGKLPADRRDQDMNFKGNVVLPLVAEKGDIVFFASDVWHRRLPSDGSLGRYFLQIHYGRRDIAQRLLPTSQVNHLSEEAILRARSAHAGLESRTIVGLHPIGYYDA